MLNQNFSKSELLNSIGDIIDVIEILRNEIFGITRRSLKFDNKILGKIHHAVNIDKYQSHEFRKKLLLVAPELELFNYLKEIKLYDSEKITEAEKLELIDKSCQLKWGNNDETRAFVRSFGYDEGIVPETIEEKTTVENIQTVGDNPFPQLFEYQYEIFAKSLELVEKSKYARLMIQMPTGAGKTRAAMEIISHFINNGINQNEERQIVWLADREELCEQAIESFQQVWPHLGKKSINLYRLWSKYEPVSFERSSVIIAGYDKLYSILKNKKKIPQPDLIICDEAHNVIARTRGEVTEKLSEHGCRIIGLTATPARQLDSPENLELKEFFNNEIVWIDPKNSENSIEYLQKKGFLAYPIPHTIDWEKSDFTISKDLLKLVARSRNLPENFLTILAENNKRNLAIAKQLIQLAEEEIRVLYFGTTRKQAKTMCALLISEGYSVAYVDGDSPTAYRRDIVKKFKSGEIKIVCNVDLFTVGFDEPKINAIVIARPTKSIVLYLQMIGRGMRGPKMGGTDSFRLYQMNDKFPGIEATNEAFTDYWKS